MRWAMLLVVLVGGCGPRVVLDEDEGDGGEVGSSSASASTTVGSSGSSNGDGDDDGDSDDEGGSDDKGDFPPDPGTSSGPPGTDESTDAGDNGTVEFCPEIEAESVYCLGSSMVAWYLVGADTGSTCAIDLPLLGYGTDSLAWIGDAVFACMSDDNGYGTLTRLNLLNGSIDTSEVECQAVAAYHGRLLLMPLYPYDPFTVYESFEDAVAGTPSSHPDVSPYASRMTVQDDLLFAAWHATHEIEVWDLATETELDPVALEGHDGWINGLAVVDNRLFLVSASAEGVFIEFDATTGARVAEHPLATASASGLACRHGG